MSQGNSGGKFMVLSPSQMEAVQETWALVYANAETHGMEMMIRLFQQMPHAKNYFVKFCNETNEVLRESEALKYHAGKMMGGVNSLVNNLDDPSALRDNIRLLSQDHSEKGVTSADFEQAFVILRQLLQDGLGDKYDTATSEAWEQCCHIIWKILDTEMKSSSSV